MNINSGLTGTVNIPGALHSTGGDGDGLVGNVVAYAGDVYDENLNANQAEINKSTIKLNEYNKVNVSYPTSEQMEGSILCNLVKNDEKILQDHSAWGSEFADYVRNHNVYIGTNFGNAGIEEEDFTGYIRGEEIVNVMNSDDKSTIVECFSSASDYWIVETESELIAEDNLYASTGTYTQRYITTPFSLQEDGNLFIKGVGGFDGTNSQSASTKSLQDVLNEIASGGVSSWNDLEDKPTILDSYDIRQIVLDKCPLHYDDSRSNYISYVPNGSNDSYTLNTVRNTYNGIVLGKYNSQDGKNNSYSDACTVVLGTSNTNDSKNSLLIGAINNNNQDNSVMLGRSNINKSEGGINIGYYNQNNGGERNVMIGYDNTSSNSASTICLGSENRFSMSYYDPSSQDIIAVGRGLYCSASGIVMGFYNVQDSVLEGDTANFLTIGDGSGNIYSSTRSNIIEQRRNGDIYIKGIGNYNGNNSRRNVQDPTRGKSLQEVLSQLTTDIQSVSANTGGGSGSSSGITIGNMSQTDPNIFVAYNDTRYLTHSINIGPNFFPENGSYYVACGYGLKNVYNVPGLSIFGKYNNIVGWGNYNAGMTQNYKPKFAVGTGTDDSHRETAILFAEFDGQPKWYLKGIGYDDTVGLGFDRDNYVSLDDTQLDLKTYIDNGDNIFAPDDIVDYFKLPMLKLDICVDSGGTLTITTNKQCAKLPLGNTLSYYAPQGSREYLSGITPTWVDNQDGTYTYTMPASESHLTGYSGQYEWMSIDPLNFYVEDGMTYRTLINTKKEWDNHLIIRNHIVSKRDYVKQGVDGGGNENKPEGMQYNPNHAPYYQVTAWQLARIMSNSN